MSLLPAGFRVIGGLSAVLGVVTGGFLAVALAGTRTAARPAPPMGVLDWLVAGAFLLTALLLILAGCLLFTRRVAAQRTAQLLLFAAAVGLALEAVLMIPATLQSAGSSSTGGLVILVTGPVFLTASIWTVVVLVTAVRLGRQLRRD